MNLKISRLFGAQLSACLLIFSMSSYAVGEINLRDFINSKIAAGEKDIRVPAGVYRLKSENRQHLVFKNLESVSIDASGAKMICLDTTRAVTISNCKNFKLKGLTIDYDPLPFTQGKISKISEDKTLVEVEISDGYPTSDKVEIEAFKYEVFNPQTRRLRTWDMYSKEVKVLSKTKFEVLCPLNDNTRKHAIAELGDGVVIAVSNIAHPAPHGVMIDSCENVTLENITLYGATAFGYFEANCKSGVYKNCSLDRCPPDKDYARRAEPRLRSGNADGFHSKYSIDGPTLINCKAMWNGDDCVAISGRYFHCVRSDGKKVRVASFVDKMNISAGDDIEIFSPRSGDLQYAKAEKVVPASPLTDGEFSVISKKVFPRTVYRTRKFSPEEIKVFDVFLNVEPEIYDDETMICATNKIGRGFKILGGAYGNNRSRGMLLRASDGLVKGATIEGARMAGILCSPEIYWYGAGHSRNVTIQDCNITAGMFPAICVYSLYFGDKFSGVGAHSNIKIKNNTIRGFYKPLVFLSSIKNLEFSGNKMSNTSSPYYEHSFKYWPCKAPLNPDNPNVFMAECQ